MNTKIEGITIAIFIVTFSIYMILSGWMLGRQASQIDRLQGRVDKLQSSLHSFSMMSWDAQRLHSTVYHRPDINNTEYYMLDDSLKREIDWEYNRIIDSLYMNYYK
jgi:hypothetical protein